MECVMPLTLFLALQAAAAPGTPAPAAPRWGMVRLIASDAGTVPGDFDLGRYRRAGAGGCAGAFGADILVCGPRRGAGGAYPMAYWERIFGPEPPIRAEMN